MALLRLIALVSFLCSLATQSSAEDGRGIARGRIEFTTATPAIIPPEDPRLEFALVPYTPLIPPVPEEIKLDPEKRREWTDKWRHSDEGKKWYAEFWRARETAPRIPFQLKPDNTFEVPDVPYGRYVVEFKSRDPAIQDRLGFGSWTLDVGPDPPPVNPSDRPTARITWSFGKGDPAPDVPLEFFDGRSTSLRELRGKTVVLHFWGVWCGPCVAGMPEWKKLRDDVAERDDIVIIDVNCGDSVEKLNAFLAEHGYDWPQAGNGGVTDGGPVTGPFGITGYPSAAVIDPEGRIVNVGAWSAAGIHKMLLGEPAPAK